MEVKFNADEHAEFREKISRAISEKSSLELTEIKNMKETLSIIEGVLSDKKIKYRSRTNNRAALVPLAGTGIIGSALTAAYINILSAPAAVGAAGALASIAAPVLVPVGVVSGIGIIGHRIFTRNPDYELVKFPRAKAIHLIYKK